MKTRYLHAASILAVLAAGPAFAQTGQTSFTQNTQPTGGAGQEATTGDQQEQLPGDIVVTAQRQSQRLQDVPIAVSAFTAENIEKQQIVNPLALQQTLPNITYTKTSFTSSSFTIRGIGDLCTGATCDSATAIHINDMPLVTTRLFETEFFDLERVEVLRGPQGTLFGRNATSGVVNFITAKPDLSKVAAAGELEYGNYDSKRARAMLNLPLAETLGVRLAGTYLKRDGFTRNLYTGNRIDDRDLYAVRGTVSWEPSSDTRLDLMGYYFREKDSRSRIQKQLCNRDPTGVLGCLPDRRAFDVTNGNTTLAAVLTSAEFLRIGISPAFAPFALNSVYGPDVYAGIVNPRDVRTVRIDWEPTYFAEEQQYMGKFFQDFGPVALNVTGGYTTNRVDSTSDYNLSVENSYANNSGLVALNAVGRPGGAAPFLNGLRQTLIPNGPNGGVCQSSADPNNVGVFGGNSIGCFPQSLDFDRSRQKSRQYSIEGHIDSKFDGIFNFLLGGIYVDHQAKDTDYFVTAFGLDYASGLIGAARTIATPGVLGNAFAAPPFYRNESPLFRLKSYGIFGEGYFEFNDRLKLTLGLRYNNDKKFVRARNLTFNVIAPIGITNITQAPAYATTDFDTRASVPGVQEYSEDRVGFDKLTGRAVIDFKITPDNLLYASYSRGYKSGGINPPVPLEFNVPTTFAPEKVDAFEIGSKNTFGGGQLRLNLTGFYYKYDNLQLARGVARTVVNENIAADIYGVEAEAIVSPVPALVVNMNASYLNTKVTENRQIVYSRDPSGGRSDAVILKDLQGAFNCAVVPTTAGNRAGTNAFVNAVNGALGLRPAVPIPSTNATGAFSFCNTVAQVAAGTVPTTSPLFALQQGLRAAFGVPTGAFPFQVIDGVPVEIRGSRLPQAPTYKFSVGAQYTAGLGGGWSVVPRADLNYTGGYYASIFNTPINRVPGYEVVNAQVQLNAPDDRFYVRGFVQNLTKNNAITLVTAGDQSSGLFTNIFTLEPRRYGVAAGFKF